MTEHIYGSIKCKRIPEFKLERREEIVRCRDCKYLCEDGSTWCCGWHCSCLTTNDGTPPDGFCAWGKRSES